MITLDLSKAKLAEDLGSYKEKVAEIHDMIQNKTGAGNDFLGWVELPENFDKEEVQLMKETAAKLREKVDVLLVCGIGGSYLGARAAIEAINGLYSDDKVEIIYVGNTFSSTYINQVAKYIEGKDFAINVISKSGTTTETSISFRIFKEMCEKKYGKEGARERIVATTDREKVDVLLVCGIGGSYLGARAAIEAINGLYSDDKVEIIYVGNTFSSTYINQVAKYIEGKDFAINVISKSGTTTETSISFRIFKEMCEKKYGKEGARERIVATTDREKGALKKLATDEGYVTFVVPDDIGGRYSVLTAVGLFPIAMAGIDIDEMLKGAKDAMVKYNDSNIETNDAYRYGVARQLLNKAGYSAEMFVTYELQLNNVAEWWKQLYGESEGKENKGILPHSAVFSTDLHSLGQFIQEGSKVLYETIFEVKNPQEDMIIPSDPDDLDGLNYLAGKSVDYVNKKACEGTIDAHVNTGNVPNIIISLDKMDAYGFGYMVYFFEMSCAMSVYFLGVNPFNQPGVEVYKKNMFKLLGKPGY